MTWRWHRRLAMVQCRQHPDVRVHQRAAAIS